MAHEPRSSRRDTATNRFATFAAARLATFAAAGLAAFHATRPVAFEAACSAAYEASHLPHRFHLAAASSRSDSPFLDSMLDDKRPVGKEHLSSTPG